MTDKSVLQSAVNELAIAAGNKAEAARIMGVPVSTFKGWVAQAEAKSITPTILQPSTQAAVAQVTMEKDLEIRKLKADLKAATHEAIISENVRDLFFGLSDHKPAPEWLQDKHIGNGQPGIPVVMLSDWHWGEVVRPSEVNGINAYNLAIAKERCERVFRNIKDMAFNHIANPDYPGIIVCLGGDMVSGDIHEELANTNELPTMPVVFDLFDKIVAGLTFLADAFGEVTVYTAFGNHGRKDQNRTHKMAAWVNFDWMLYNMLERHFKACGDKRITITVHDSFDQLFDVYGQKFLLTHGDRLGVRGGDGIIGIVGPIIRGAKKVKANYNSMGTHIDTLIVGHWHQYTPLKLVRVNGSLKGYDEYAMSGRFDPEDPVQDMFLVHPRHGITQSIPVFANGNQD
jgi:predicted phosphodiesterase